MTFEAGINISGINIYSLFYICFLLVTLTLGWRAGKRIRSAAGFHVANQDMGWPVLLGSFLASNVSIGFFLGATNMAGRIGYAFWCAYFTTALGFLFALGVIGVLVRRLAGRYPIYSFGDLLAIRYGSRAGSIRAVSGILMCLIYLPYMAAQFSGLAAITSSILDLPYRPVLIGSVLFVIIYTLWGGMIGVIWTDSFMFLVLLLGIIVALPVGVLHIGGGDPAAAWQRLTEQLPGVIFQGTQPDWPWVAVMGQAIWIFAFAAEPHLITRFLTARNEATILKALPFCVGLSLVIYGSSIPLALLGRLASPDLPETGYYYIELARTSLGPWIGGLALSGVAAAALSTCSTEMIITSQALSRDLYQKYLRPQAQDPELVRVSRLSVFLIGLLTLVMVLFDSLGIFWLVFLSVSLLISAFFVPVVLGLLWKGGSGTAALAAMIAGPSAAVLVFVLNSYFKWSLSSLEAYAGLLASLGVYLAVSRVRPPAAEELEVAAGLAWDGDEV